MRMASAMFVTALTFTLLPPAGATPACADAPLRINEFMAGPSRDWDGSGIFSSRDDEWIELVSLSPAALDLAGFILTDGDSVPRLALSGMLAPGALRLVFGKESYDWERATGHPAFGFSLGNSGDAVMLWQVSGAETLLVDSYTYRSHEAAADRAVGRAPDGTGSWTLYDGLDPYSGSTPPPGTGCMPTPAEPNGCQLTPATATTWGRIKTRYR